NTNISAIAAQNSLRTTGLNQSTAMERLSSGIRINSAKDDAAGLAISTRMTANIRGLAAAIRNANDGISLTQTAEGSLASISDNLQRIRELAVQSANSTNYSTDRAALNAEAAQLVSEIDRVASNSTFNGIKLLDGSYQDQALQVGAGNEANDRISVSIASAKSSSLGVGGGSSYNTSITSAAVGATAMLSGGLSINGFVVGASNTDGVSSTGSDASGIAVAAAINAVSGQSAVVATVQKTERTGTTVADGAQAALASGAVLINGVNIGAIEAAASPVARGAQMTAAINAKSGQTGVVATFSTTTGAVNLSALDGRNIAITATTGTTQTGTGLTFTEGADVTTITRSTVKLASSNAAGITIAGITAASLTASGLTAGYSASTATAGAGVSTIDLSTAAGSQTALSTLDKAINSITDSRASMGAYQNRLTASVANLENSSMNLQASRSRILDTDYAKETTNLAKAQIIQQAATAMLAQANQSAQSVLALLK
ncbi:MAG: flagellin, partial [Betaproteobacteria bacterium]|nr:flagellin [Betaproteobacteria bacterium]